MPETTFPALLLSYQVYTMSTDRTSAKYPSAQKLPTRAALEYLRHLGHTDMRWYLHHKMNVISLNTHLAYPPPVHFTRLVHEPFEPDDYFALQRASSIFWNPYRMILKSMLCMSPFGKFGHGQIMPDFPPLLQPGLASSRDTIHPQA